MWSNKHLQLVLKEDPNYYDNDDSDLFDNQGLPLWKGKLFNGV